MRKVGDYLLCSGQGLTYIKTIVTPQNNKTDSEVTTVNDFELSEKFYPKVLPNLRTNQSVYSITNKK